MFEEYSVTRYKKTFAFFSRLSKESRINLSSAGISNRCLFNMFKKHTYEPEVKSILLIEKGNIVALGRINLEDGYLSGIVVGDKHRKEGYGTKLVEYLISLAKDKGLPIISLEVKIENQVAIDFYKNLNFKSLGQKCEGLLWMEKKIKLNSTRNRKISKE